MSKFKVGEIAILQHCDHKENNGKEAEIKAISMAANYDYDVIIEGVDINTRGCQWSANEYQLKKLPPPDTQSSWEEMKEIFIPKGVEA